MTSVDLRLYGILDPGLLLNRDLADIARQAIAGGCTLLQYRDKSGDARTMIDRIRTLKEALAGSNVPLLINDRADIAKAANADGVHLGQDDLPVQDARALLDPNAIIGLTIKSESQAEALTQSPVDYACIGGVFTTVSKHNPEPPLGLAGLARVAAIVHRTSPGLPLGAIAGIDASNASDVIAAGVDGVAVISALTGADDVISAARVLRHEVDSALERRRTLP